MTETTTSVRAQSQAPIERIRLERKDAGPISGAWRQDGSALVGQLAFTDACGTETLQQTKLVEVTDTHPNRRYSMGAYITGTALSLLGVALIANAQGKSEQVTCGNGSSAPQSGDRCDSEAGAWRAAGASILGSGLGAILVGAIVAGRKPVVTSKDLPSQERVLITPGPRSCGNIAALKDATVAATLSSGGKWTSTVDAEGNVRVDLSGAALQRGTLATFTLESVPPDASPIVPIGTLVGQLQLQPLRNARTLVSAR
jgi:hypothetical protein